MSQLFSHYGTSSDPSRASAWDEMFTTLGDNIGADQVRPGYADLYQALLHMSQEELRSRADALASSYLAQGVTFDFAGEERPFPLDAIPRIVEAAEWARIETGVAQRVRALEAFLADVYGRQDAVRDGVIPAHVIVSAPGFLRQAAGIEPAGGVRVHVAGIDLIRDAQGEWRVLEDNVRVPSGVSYVISNREVMAQTLPELFAKMSIQPVTDYPRRLVAALRASAPPGVEEPTVVVLTPGVFNSAYFEHTLLARLMGVELVEGRDLFCSGGFVWMRTTSGPQKVDVIYRRVDDDFLDPLQFRADSVLGAPGLLTVARAGNVTIANAIGNGVADDKLVYTYVPDLIRYFLHEEPVLPNVDSWRLEDPGALSHVLNNIRELVVKPVDGSGGKGLVVGDRATDEQLAALKEKVTTNPRGWIAQPIIQLSTIPTLVEGGMAPRHSDLRPFAVSGEGPVWVLPGGLTRVALPEGQLVVNSSQGGGSKDTWVVGAPSGTAAPPVVPQPSTRFQRPATNFYVGHQLGQGDTFDDDESRLRQQIEHQQQQLAQAAGKEA
ncbi:MAG: circularly permuted type 2 ATP-grasp protein [Bifidobacteriaceae bacterium]|jgi:uncharacterized circularly permuted ATP-grasp superfamily protein|nr:circularly permuted type 2 ATP-grasp protein [Bifidobacteriaceae bacterium]